jgi:hypothetical protein
VVREGSSRISWWVNICSKFKQRSLFGRSRLFASETPEKICFCKCLSIGRAWSLMFILEPPINSECLWVTQRTVMASLGSLAMVFFESMTNPSRGVGDHLGGKIVLR